MINYSVIIPHKNSPELLDRCLKSIPERNDIEIIVIDDFSDENLRPKVDRSGAKVIYVTKEQTKGAGRARNIGLKQATGKWLLFADCDDYYINDCFNKLDKLKDTDYDIVFFDYGTNVNSGHTTFKTRLNAMLKGRARERANFKHSLNAPWNKMYKRQFIIDNDVLFDETPRQNDAYFVHKASSLTDNFSYINEKLYYYEINDKGITHRKRKKEDVPQAIDVIIRLERLKASSGAWDCIDVNINKQQIKDYGFFFMCRQHMRRIRHGLIWYMIRKYLW